MPAPAPGFLGRDRRPRPPGARLLTHLDYRADPRSGRPRSPTRWGSWRRTGGDLQILTGDFNARAECARARRAVERLTDSWTAAATAGGPFTYPAVGPVKRIDFVTVGAGFRVRRASVPL